MQDASKMAKKVCRGVIGAQSASTNGGDASRVGERCSCYLVELVCFSFMIPTRDASPPLEVAFGGSVLMIAFYASVWWWRLVLEGTLALMGATRLASGKDAAVI